jgi:hypothetical protein
VFLVNLNPEGKSKIWIGSTSSLRLSQDSNVSVEDVLAWEVVELGRPVTLSTFSVSSVLASFCRLVNLWNFGL